MLVLALAALIAAPPARAGAAARCWERRAVAGRTADVAFIKDGAKNLGIDLGVKRFAKARALDCVDAVLYDGGHAQGFAAGRPDDPDAIDDPPEPIEDANPSHLFFKACD